MHLVDDSESHKKTAAIEFMAGRVREREFLEAIELFSSKISSEFLVITDLFENYSQSFSNHSLKNKLSDFCSNQTNSIGLPN